MAVDKYFVFECYAGAKMLFRSYGRQSSKVTPVPLADPALRIQQQAAKASGQHLSYNFICSGLSCTDAQERLLQLNNCSCPRLSPEEATPETEKPPGPEVVWLDCCGSRLSTRSSDVTGPSNKQN